MPTFNRFATEQIDGKRHCCVCYTRPSSPSRSHGFAAASFARHETAGRGATRGGLSDADVVASGGEWPLRCLRVVLIKTEIDAFQAFTGLHAGVPSQPGCRRRRRHRLDREAETIKVSASSSPASPTLSAPSCQLWAEAATD